MKYCNALLFLLLFIPFAAHGLPDALGEGKEIAADSAMTESAEERGFQSGFINAFIRGYDTEGRLGVGTMYSVIPEASSTAMLDHYPGVYYKSRFSTQWLVDAPLGSSYRFHSHVPFYGWVSGRGRVETGEHTAWYVIPVKGSQDGMVELEERDYLAGSANIAMTPILMDSLTSATIAVVNAPFNIPTWYANRGGRVVIETIGGLSSITISNYFTPGSLSSSRPQLYWGNDDVSEFPNLFKVGDAIPTEPVRISFALDGYTTATLTTNSIVSGKVTVWNAPMISTGDAPTASDYINDPFYRFQDGQELRDAPGATGMLLEVSR